MTIQNRSRFNLMERLFFWKRDFKVLIFFANKFIVEIS